MGGGAAGDVTHFAPKSCPPVSSPTTTNTVWGCWYPWYWYVPGSACGRVRACDRPIRSIDRSIDFRREMDDEGTGAEGRKRMTVSAMSSAAVTNVLCRICTSTHVLSERVSFPRCRQTPLITMETDRASHNTRPARQAATLDVKHHSKRHPTRFPATVSINGGTRQRLLVRFCQHGRGQQES